MKAIWPKSPPKLVASALAGHSALGIALGALMFILCLSGTLAVFFNEFERWEQPAAPEIAQFDPAAAQMAASNMLERIDFQPHHFYIALPTDDNPRMVVSAYSEDNAHEAAFVADAQGNLAGEEHHPWTHFLTNLHIYFHIPNPTIGITVVGVMGAMLLGLMISGFAAHPRIFRDAFTFRLGGSKRLSEADLHNRLSVWASPFHFIIALTGAMIGLSSVMALLVAAIAYNGDTTKAFAPIFRPDQEIHAEGRAPLANIAGAIAHLQATQPNATPSFISMHDPATNAQSLQVQAIHHDRLAYAETYNYTNDGTLIAAVGLTSGPIGQQAFASSYTLHFGSFGGPLVRLAYGILGIALCIVTATGINIWLVKRREKNRPAPRLERAWIGVVWGSCLSLAVALAAACSGVAEGTLVPIFWLLLIAIVTAGIPMRSNRLLSRSLRISTGVSIIFALAFHGAREGVALLSPAGWPVTLGLLAAAIIAFASASAMFRRQLTPVPAPAE